MGEAQTDVKAFQGEREAYIRRLQWKMERRTRGERLLGSALDDALAEIDRLRDREESDD